MWSFLIAIVALNRAIFVYRKERIGGVGSFLFKKQFFLGVGPRPVRMASSGAASETLVANNLDRDLSRKSRLSLTPKSCRLENDFAKFAGITLDSRDTVFKRLDFGHHHNSRVQMLKDGPQPTHKTELRWNPSHQTICITKKEGSKWATRWVEVRHVNDQGPGLVPLKLCTEPIEKISLGPKLIPFEPTTLEPIQPKSPILRNIVEPVGL